MLNTLLDVLQQLIPYDSANIMLPDDPDVFRVGYLRGYETGTDPDAVKALRFDATQRPPLAQIIATRRSLLIFDTHQEPGWEPMTGTRSIGCWLGVPLIANNMLVGIFSIDRHQPNSLVANMDIQMPGVDGLEAIRRIRADGTLAQTPIIAVTALALPCDRDRCLEAGADEYRAKPVSLRMLVQTIESLRMRRAETDCDMRNDEASPLS